MTDPFTTYDGTPETLPESGRLTYSDDAGVFESSEPEAYLEKGDRWAYLVGPDTPTATETGTYNHSPSGPVVPMLRVGTEWFVNLELFKKYIGTQSKPQPPQRFKVGPDGQMVKHDGLLGWVRWTDIAHNYAEPEPSEEQGDSDPTYVVEEGWSRVGEIADLIRSRWDEIPKGKWLRDLLKLTHQPARVSKVKKAEPEPKFGEWMGFPVYVDPELPPDTVEIRSDSGSTARAMLVNLVGFKWEDPEPSEEAWTLSWELVQDWGCSYPPGLGGRKALARKLDEFAAKRRGA